MENFYNYVLENTVGSLDRHSLNRVLLNLANIKAKIFYFGNLSGCPISQGAELIEDNNRLMLNGILEWFNDDNPVYFTPEQLAGSSDTELTSSRFYNSNDQEHYISDESGMFLQSQTLNISSLWIDTSKAKLTIEAKRIQRVKEYFSRYGSEYPMKGLGYQEIYKLIGSPSQNTLWDDWQRLWPDTFKANFQKEFFRKEPLKKINYAQGTGKGRDINPKLKK
ncbi:MAG: hypothetical protein HWE26_19705 [Alteromonadaceae bacterium]|nr:hypothetical protein [Alteromonadaceae bacterium]